MCGCFFMSEALTKPFAELNIIVLFKFCCLTCATSCENVSYDMCEQCSSIPACSRLEKSYAVRLNVTHFFRDLISGQGCSWPDCAIAQAGVELFWSRMTFSLCPLICGLMHR